MIPLLLIADTKQELKLFLKNRDKDETITVTLNPQLSEYSIDQIREIGRELKVSQPIRKIYVLEDFDKSSLEAQNAFLKLLEEPPENVEFILVVSNPYSLLPTIISRTKLVRSGKRKDVFVDAKLKKALDFFISKKNMNVLDFSLFTASTKDTAFDILDQLCVFFQERFTQDRLAPQTIKEILSVYQLVKNNNLNPQLALDHLLIFIAKKYSMKI